MPKSFTLSIPTPCSEQWSAMTATETGRFCAHCAKNVLDFTALSDEMLMQVIAENQGKLCGKLTQRQLNRVYSFAETQKGTPKYGKYIAAFFLMGGGIVAQAQQATPAATPVEHSSRTSIATRPQQNYPALQIIKGTVTDTITNEPLIGCTVRLKDTDIGVLTNVNGHFVISIPDTHPSEVVLLITYTGYQSQEFKVMRDKLPVQVALTLDTNELILLGELFIESPASSYKWWQFWKKRRH